MNEFNEVGIVLLPPNYSEKRRRQWIMDLKEALQSAREKPKTKKGKTKKFYDYYGEEFVEDFEEKKRRPLKLLVNQKLLWTPGPPGFDVVFGNSVAWRIAWRPFKGETKAQQDAWSRTLPLDLKSSLEAGAIDLR